jgi:stage IV sporulation protein FB
MSSSTARAAPKPWSVTLGRPGGVDVRVHVTFVLVVVWSGAVGLLAAGDVPGALWALAFVLAIFGCVVLHELGHATAARRYGIATRDITLYPIGGVARLERMPTEPGQELVIALAGPLVNVALAALLGAILLAFPGLASAGAGPVGEGFLPRLLLTNVFLAGFNLLPAFPMDGGRVLRALLARRMDRARATRTAATAGQVMAVLFAAIGIFGGSFMLVLIAVFVWIGAAQESMGVAFQAAVQGASVANAMETQFCALESHEPLARAEGLLLAGPQIDFPVVSEDGRLLGLISREAIVSGIAEHGERAPVRAAMAVNVPVTTPDEPLPPAFERLAQSGQRCAPVLDKSGVVVGLLTADNLADFVGTRQARSRRLPATLGTAGLMIIAAAISALGTAGCDDEEADVPTNCSTNRASHEDEGERMEPGGPCIGCHMSEDEGPVYGIAGTVMSDYHDDQRCAGERGVTVVITGADGEVIELETNDVGNFFYKGSVSAPYTAKVVRDGVERTRRAVSSYPDRRERA